MIGIVKWFNEAKGFGFIVADGVDYIAHYSEIDGVGFKTLEDGQKVKFTPKISPKGGVAKNISITDK
jgi:CspA family cold shock protein